MNKFSAAYEMLLFALLLVMQRENSRSLIELFHENIFMSSQTV